jgi:hypothetical protein
MLVPVLIKSTHNCYCYLLIVDFHALIEFELKEYVWFKILGLQNRLFDVIIQRINNE